IYRRWISVTVIVAVTAMTAALIERMQGPAAAPRSPRSDGGPSIRAPRGPELPENASDGVRLIGVVVDGAGAAVGGASVSAELELGVGGPAVLSPTGADGRFALDNLSAGRYRLRVDGPGLLAAEVRYVPV